VSGNPSPPPCEPTFLIMREPRRLTTLPAFTACYMDSFTIIYSTKLNKK
jgi:hypothetical protein